MVSEGVLVEERVSQANERYGFGAMRSRPLQTAGGRAGLGPAKHLEKEASRPWRGKMKMFSVQV